MFKKYTFIFLFLIIAALSVSLILATEFASKDNNKDTLVNNTIIPSIPKAPDPIVIKRKVLLGDDQVTTSYSHLIKGKKIGLVTNHTGINSSGKHIIDILSNYKDTKLTAIYTPEHGLDGKAGAGDYVYSHQHPKYNIPVYSLYGETRLPTKDMLKNIDILLFDVQDIGIRSYTYISTLNYCMKAAKQNNKTVVVLDRPNPLGGITVEGYVAEDKFLSFVGVDNLPVSHGMTIGELAKFFNRKIGVSLEVVPMKNYHRNMTFNETGLDWIATSPRIPTIESAFNYSATGIGEGLKFVKMGNNFNWVGAPGVDSQTLSDTLNDAKLPGIRFEPKSYTDMGGANLIIKDFQTYNPAKTGIYILVYIHNLTNYNIPKSKGENTMFQKIHGTDQIGNYIEKGLTPEEIIKLYTPRLEAFKKERHKYLIYK